MKRILLIDGDYFANRQLGIVNMKDNVNNLITQKEQDEFKNSLKTGIVNIFKNFKNIVDDVVMVCDDYSWRKNVETFKPYYIPENDTTPLKYKENRSILKSESEIDYKKFREIYNDFVEDLKQYINIIKIDGLEGDDCLYLLNNYFKNIPKIETITFCTDKDLYQIVTDNGYLFRNIQSKNKPSGEISISKNLYDKVFKKQKSGNEIVKNLVSELVEVTKTENLFSNYDNIFNFNMFNPQYPVKRELNNGIEIVEPYKTAFIKTIAGDKKDNVFGLVRWKAKTGSDRNYGLSEKMIKSIFDDLLLDFTEEECKNILFDERKQLDYILGIKLFLKKKTNQIPTDMELINHFNHNKKLILLDINNLPKESVDKFNLYIEENLDEEFINSNTKTELLLDDEFEKFTREFLGSLTVGTNISYESIPDEDSLI